MTLLFILLMKLLFKQHYTYTQSEDFTCKWKRGYLSHVYARSHRSQINVHATLLSILCIGITILNIAFTHCIIFHVQSQV